MWAHMRVITHKSWPDRIQYSSMDSSSHEELDSRIISNLTNISCPTNIKIFDTDVLVLFLGCFKLVWIKTRLYTKKTHYDTLVFIKYSTNLRNNCAMFSWYHFFTNRDYTDSFNRKGKTSKAVREVSRNIFSRRPFWTIWPRSDNRKLCKNVGKICVKYIGQ